MALTSMRPWPLSMSLARTRSAGSLRVMGWPGRLASREGGIIAEGMNQFGFEFRLIGLHEQQIVTALGADRLEDRAIGEGGIAGDHRALQRQRLQQLERLDHLGAVGRPRQRADRRLEPGRER